MTIIEADGADTKPWSTDHLQVASGQRFSILLQTKSVAELIAGGRSSFWIRYENRERPANVSGYALLSYDLPGIDLPEPGPPNLLPDVSPITLPQTVYDWAEYALQPFDASIDPFPTRQREQSRL